MHAHNCTNTVNFPAWRQGDDSVRQDPEVCNPFRLSLTGSDWVLTVKHSTQLSAVQAVPCSCQQYKQCKQCKQYKQCKQCHAAVSGASSTNSTSSATSATPTSGKNEVLPDPPRAKASSAVAASVKGLRASCEEEFGLSARYCSTELEKVIRPSGSLSRCCSSGASHGRAITAE